MLCSISPEVSCRTCNEAAEASPRTVAPNLDQQEVILLAKKIPRTLTADGGSKVDAAQGFCGAAERILFRIRSASNCCLSKLWSAVWLTRSRCTRAAQGRSWETERRTQNPEPRTQNPE